jgi:hypothetical protein
MYVPTPNSVIRRMSMAIFTDGNLTQGDVPLLDLAVVYCELNKREWKYVFLMVL